MEMATKVVYTSREDKKDLQKQFGCMNGIFQLFDRRYLLGLNRHGRNQNKLIKGEGENGGKEFKNSSEKVKEKETKRVVMEKNRVSVDSSRNSCSSSCSSTTFSSLDCGRRVKPEIQISFEPTSPYLQKSQPDIREVVKDSMTRTIRVSSLVKNVQKEHIDSPRPLFVHQKSLKDERKDRNLAKEGSRYSCDERESKYSLKSTLKVKEVPRFSLDSKQVSKNSKNFVNSENTPEPGSNKRPSSGVVAKLMGLDGFDKDSIVEVKSLTIKPFLDNEMVSRLKGKNGKRYVSVYGEMEKRLSGIEFKTSGKDLRALKQILEAIKNKERSLDSQKMVKPVSPMVKGTRSELVKEVKPGKLTKVNYGESRNDLVERKKVKDLTPRKKKVTSGTPRLLTCQNSPGQLTGERLKKSKKRSTDLTRIKTKNPKTKSVSPMKNNEESCIETRNDQPKEVKVNENAIVEKLIDDKQIVELPKLIIEQPSPVSVLDVFYNEDTISPLKNKTISFKDYETLKFDEDHEIEWNQVDDYSEFNLDFLNNEDHKYIGEILLTSGFLKDLDSAIQLVQIHPTGNLIKPNLFNFLEKKEQYTNESHKKTQVSKRKMVFDFVNEILLHKLTVVSIWNGKRRRGILNGEKLLKQLCSELDNLQIAPERFVDNEDDEVKILVSVDMSNKSQDWDECCEIPGVVLDIERLIFKDLIDEVVNADMACPRRQCRRL